MSGMKRWGYEGIKTLFTAGSAEFFLTQRRQGFTELTEFFLTQRRQSFTEGTEFFHHGLPRLAQIDYYIIKATSKKLCKLHEAPSPLY